MEGSCQFRLGLKQGYMTNDHRFLFFRFSDFCGVEVKRKRVVLLALVAAFGLGCKDDPADTSGCAAGARIPCACPGGATGEQVCSADGASLGACECPGEPPTSNMTASEPELEGERVMETLPVAPSLSPTTTTPEPATTATALFGAECAADAECGAGLTCLTAEGSSDFFGNGGPANGYCSANCDDDSDCTHVDRAGACFRRNGVGTCLRRCLSLDPEPGEGKCLDRADLACVSPAAAGAAFLTDQRELGFCIPICDGDGGCGSRVCHAAGGLCTDAPAVGFAIGASCAEDGDCAGGVCELLASGGGVCAQLCKFGGLSGCGVPESSAAPEAGCLTPFVVGSHYGEGQGDLGLCRELCDIAEDCLLAPEGWECTATPVAERFGRAGACTPPRAAEVPAEEEPTLEESEGEVAPE
jgi:hypothetical protein